MSDAPIATPAAAPVTVLDAATANAQDQALADRLTKAEAAIAALQAGQPQPPQNTPSPDGTTVTAIGGGSIIDAQLRAMTLVQPPAGTTSPGIAVNGVYSTGTQAVARLYAKSQVCYQQNTAGNWWSLNAGGTWVTATDPTGSTPVPPNPSSGALTIANGQLLRGGQPFLIKGVSIIDAMMTDFPASWLIGAFPGINSVNLAIGADGSGYSTRQPDSILYGWIDGATAQGLVVTVSDYMPGQPLVRTGADLTNSCNWYATVAGRYKANNNILWLTENEVQGNPDLTTSHQAIYNAIRGAGANQPIGMESWCGNPQTTGLNAAAYGSMTNIFWNIHMYPWMMPTTQNQADYDAKARQMIAMFQNFARSKDGVMPVLFGEAGNSTNGNGGSVDDRIIAGKYATPQAWINTRGGSGGSCGDEAWVCSWHWQQSPPPPAPEESDTLVRHDKSLSNYGAQVAASFAA